MVVTARSREPYGPWENSPYNPVTHTYSDSDTWWSRGHGTIFDDAQGQWWMVYHAYRKNYHTLGRQTLIVPIEWTSDGWPRTTTRQCAPFSPQQPNPSDNFRSKKLGWQWVFWKEYAPQALHWRGHRLSIDGKGNDATNGRLLMVNATDTCYEVTADVMPSKKATGGLLLFYNEKAHTGITLHGSEASIVLNGENLGSYRINAHKGCAIRIRNRRGKAEFAVSTDNRRTWQVLSSLLDASTLHHNRYGQFLSLRVALLAAGPGTTQFARFTYKALD